MIGLGLSGAVSVIATVFILEVGTVLADIVGKRKVEETVGKNGSRKGRGARAGDESGRS